LTDNIQFGFFKYKTNVDTIVDCVREYPINEDILKLLEENNIIYEIEMDNGKPKLIDGLGVILI